MINIGFKNRYKVLHFTNEIGSYIVGGMATFINQLYTHHTDEIGFVHFYNSDEDLSLARYPGQKNILAVSYDELDRLKELSFDIAVSHFYFFDFLINEEILQDKPLVYIVHSVPTTEPYDLRDPFGGNHLIKEQFEKSCRRADVIVNISKSEQKKLTTIYPSLEPKTHMIYNGMDFQHPTNQYQRKEQSQKHFGFLGRLDHRKGLLETVKAFRGLNAHLHIACGNEDPFYLNQILSFIEAADMGDKVHFHGWCQGERKESFLQFIDALIVPSLYEPFGYVVIEAMSHQTPLLCSNSGAFTEITGNHPYMFDPYQPETIKDCIQYFQNDSTENIQLHTMALVERLPLFTSTRMIDQYNQLFNNIENSLLEKGVLLT
ncbi:glycosyltransferase family 4 protein [Marinicrinis sediminis]|uniref:Glycosyltransferase family 4 protein n=1 Tax=Marinicrinis sediminis TaxID=1652465 RepID=A0ABW5R8V6_9BACL